jgi:hypothetical protein
MSLCGQAFAAEVPASSERASDSSAQLELWTQEARAKVKVFAQQLKGTLKQELSSQVPVSAVQVCSTEAPKIAAMNRNDTKSDGQWQVSRTALKVRNPNNVPDQWEKAVLLQFEQALAAGLNPAALEHAELIDGEFRYMKAIPTGEVCLACHGGSLAPAVKAAIDQAYPQDQAVGFSVGQLRGAFSVIRK